MKKDKCIKCGSKKWEKGNLTTDKIGLFYCPYKCKECGYIYNVVDYVKSGKIDTSKITVNKIN